MSITKQQLKQLVQEVMKEHDEERFSQERYARAGFPEGGPEGDPMDEPGAWTHRGKEEVEGEDYIIYKGMKYMLPMDPEERNAVEAFIDAFLDPTRE